MIIFDWSQCSIAAMSPFFDEMKKKPEEAENIARHSILSKVKNIRHKFREYGQVVIACDGDHYWRKDIFPHYKAGRKETKAKSDIPWDLVDKLKNQIAAELFMFSPYKVIRHAKAEADDIMGILTLDVALHSMVDIGLEQENEPVLLVTSDGDMKQLHIARNIRQYSPMHDKFIRLEMPAKDFLREKILTGDSGDGIPNVFSPNTSFVTKTRQKACTREKMDIILQEENLVDGSADAAIKARIKENTSLIDFTHIPQWLRDDIVEKYNTKPRGTKMDFFKYLANKKCKVLMDEVDKF